MNSGHLWLIMDVEIACSTIKIVMIIYLVMKPKCKSNAIYWTVTNPCETVAPVSTIEAELETEFRPDFNNILKMSQKLLARVHFSHITLSSENWNTKHHELMKWFDCFISSTRARILTFSKSSVRGLSLADTCSARFYIHLIYWWLSEIFVFYFTSVSKNTSLRQVMADCYYAEGENVWEISYCDHVSSLHLFTRKNSFIVFEYQHFKDD